MVVFPPHAIALAKRKMFMKNNQKERTMLGMFLTLPNQGKAARERKIPRTEPRMLIAIAMLDGGTNGAGGGILWKETKTRAGAVYLKEWRVPFSGLDVRRDPVQ